MTTVICHTDGCGNADIPIEFDFTGVPSDEMPTSFWCGVCAQQITDIQEDTP
jgi:hypothetical protein